MPEVMSDKLAADLIYAAVLKIRSSIVPALSTPEARMDADLITRLLLLLHVRFSSLGKDLEQLIAADEDLYSTIERLVPGPSTAQQLGAPNADLSALEQLERRRYEIEVAIASKLPALLVQAATGSDSAAAAVAAVGRILELQRGFMASQDPDIRKGSYVVYQGGKLDADRVPPPPRIGGELTAELLTARVQSRFPGALVKDLSIASGGFSKTTAFFTLVLASGEQQALVLRKDLPLEFVSSVVYEFPLLQRLYKIGFPVAEPVWLEDDPTIVGGCFMVSRRAAGSVDFREWAGDPQAVRSFARQLAKVMADLHALDPAQFGFEQPVKQHSAAHFLLNEIDRWHRMLERERIEPHLLGEVILHWLKSNIPRTVFERSACLVHGDIGFHNMMIDRGQVTALLDWEFSHVADPIVDLIYTKTFIEKVMDWEEFKAFYYEYGGPVCTPEEETYYTIWSKIRVSIPGVRCASIFTKHLPDELKYAASGFVLARYLELDAAEHVLEALRG